MASRMDEILAEFEVGAISFKEAVRRAAPLLPEGEPDTADLVGRINEICDRAGIGEGSPVELVQALADKLAEARADLDAERAQLDAKPKWTGSVNLALSVLDNYVASSETKLALAVLREAFA